MNRRVTVLKDIVSSLKEKFSFEGQSLKYVFKEVISLFFVIKKGRFLNGIIRLSILSYIGSLIQHFQKHIKISV